MTEAGALAHLDALASKYVGRPTRYFGDCIPARFAGRKFRSCAGSGRPTSWPWTRPREAAP